MPAIGFGSREPALGGKRRYLVECADRDAFDDCTSLFEPAQCAIMRGRYRILDIVQCDILHRADTHTFDAAPRQGGRHLLGQDRIERSTTGDRPGERPY